MVCKIQQFVDYTDVLKTNLPDFLNKVISIVHQCAFRWDGWANHTEGNKFVITWKMPELEAPADNERNEFLQEQRTEVADKSLITAIKIVSEIRRANYFSMYFRKQQMVQRFGSQTKRPYLTFGLHLGWTVEGAIGSDNKIDACYLSPHM